MSQAVLITGATGKQGGSVINALLKQNADFEILALTRDPHSQSAQKLLQKSANIKLVTGNLDDVHDVFQQVKAASQRPVCAVFSVQVPPIGFGKIEGIEERQGKALIDVALENGVGHFVYSSVDRGGSRSDHDATDIPHFISKHNIEQHLYERTKNGKMSWTVLRPVAFFENLVPGFIGKVFTTSWNMTLGKEQKLQLIATSDIGYFAAQALMKPEEYKNRKLSLAGDALTYEQFASIFKNTTGRDLPTTYWFVAGTLNWMAKELGYMFRWFRDVGYGADIQILQRMHPDLKDFATWLKHESQFMSS